MQPKAEPDDYLHQPFFAEPSGRQRGEKRPRVAHNKKRAASHKNAPRSHVYYLPNVGEKIYLGPIYIAIFPAARNSAPFSISAPSFNGCRKPTRIQLKLHFHPSVPNLLQHSGSFSHAFFALEPSKGTRGSRQRYNGRQGCHLVDTVRRPFFLAQEGKKIRVMPLYQRIRLILFFKQVVVKRTFPAVV